MPKLQPGEKIIVKPNQKTLEILWKIYLRIKQQEQEAKTKDVS